MPDKLIKITIFIVLVFCPYNFYGQSADDLSKKIISTIEKKEKGCEIETKIIEPRARNNSFSDSGDIFQELICDNQSFTIGVLDFSSKEKAIEAHKSYRKTGFTGWGTPPKIIEERIDGLPQESLLAIQTNGVFYHLIFRIDKHLIIVSAPNENIAKRFSKYIFEAMKIE